MSTKPRLQSTSVPGLVMWPNGAIVRVKLTARGEIERDAMGSPSVLASYGRVTGEDYMTEAAFRAVEAHVRP